MTGPSELSERLLELLQQRYGIGAHARTPGWLASRLERAATLLVQGAAAREGDVIGFLRTHPAELEQLSELVRVGETRFFRDPEQWRALSAALSEWAPRARLRALSAGCSTGEEAWTLALVLGRAGLGPFRVVGVDRSTTALEVARAGVYPEECRAQIPVQYLERFTRSEPRMLTVPPELHPMVSFQRRDLLEGPPPGNYEIIVCKNLLIYLNPAAAERVLGALFRALAPGGMLLVARAELAKVKALGLPLGELGPGVSVVCQHPRSG